MHFRAVQFAIAFINIQPDRCRSRDEGNKEMRETDVPLCMTEGEGMFSQGPALPWKLDEEKLFKYKNEGSRQLGTGKSCKEEDIL
jgi:hypothetical protein